MAPEENQNAPTDNFSQIVARLKEANNVLVTVKASPTVDQLAACIGLTIALNKQNKHATAVFSGEVPSTIEFLEPDKTLEKNTDSLRDFIISLDKSKADKLRYKVEEEVVKIFITPYRTSISEDDLNFSQGDFNVDVVIALGVHDRNDLDQAIVAHGRILHDATIISVNTDPGAELGSINWADGSASSLCEMVSDLVESLGKDLLDSQIATALLTGVVAETDRFRNEKATPHTMSVSGVLMSAGASTQLVAAKLEEPLEPSTEIPEVVDNGGEGEAPKHDDGTIEIDHSAEDFQIDDSGNLKPVEEQSQQQDEPQVPDEEPIPEDKVTEPPAAEVETIPLNTSEGPTMALEPPTLGGQLTANSVPEHQQYSGSVDPLSNVVPDRPTLSHKPPAISNDNGDKTLREIEESLNSPHVSEGPAPATTYPDPADITPPPMPTEQQAPSVIPSASEEPTIVPSGEEVPPPPPPEAAREAVEEAVQQAEEFRPEPIEALNAMPVGLEFHENDGKEEPPKEEEKKSDDNPPPPVPPPLPPM